MDLITISGGGSTLRIPLVRSTKTRRGSHDPQPRSLTAAHGDGSRLRVLPTKERMENLTSTMTVFDFGVSPCQ